MLIVFPTEAPISENRHLDCSVAIIIFFPAAAAAAASSSSSSSAAAAAAAAPTIRADFPYSDLFWKTFPKNGAALLKRPAVLLKRPGRFT